jgi:hypothetical protein
MVASICMLWDNGSVSYPAPTEIEAVRRELQRRISDGKQAKAELQKRISDGKQAEAELSRLDEWLKTGEVLISGLKANGVTANTGIKLRKIGRQNPLSSVAEDVLRRTGKLHVNALIENMRKQGWVSTGDNRLDMKNVFSVLSRSKRFIKVGRNIWDIAPQAKADK